MYKIYKFQLTQFGEPVIAIVSAFRNAGGHFKAECFCVFPRPHVDQKFTAIRFDHKSFAESPVELNEEFMLEEALTQARIEVALHIETNYDKNGLPTVSGSTFEEAGIALLAHLQVRGHANFLLDICDKSDCEELRQALGPLGDLQKVALRSL